MTFWNDSNFEPKRVFRWKVTLLTVTPGAAGAAGANVPSYYAKKATKPTLTVEEAEHKYLNKSFYFPGHLKWDPVTVTLVDDSNSTLVESLTESFRRSNYDLVAGGNTNLNRPDNPDISGLKTLPKGKMVQEASAGQNVLIEQLNAEGGVIESITLYNAWIKSFKPSELNYDAEDLSTYDVEFRYDWASFE